MFLSHLYLLFKALYLASVNRHCRNNSARLGFACRRSRWLQNCLNYVPYTHHR